MERVAQMVEESKEGVDTPNPVNAPLNEDLIPSKKKSPSSHATIEHSVAPLYHFFHNAPLDR